MLETWVAVCVVWRKESKERNSTGKMGIYIHLETALTNSLCPSEMK